MEMRFLGLLLISVTLARATTLSISPSDAWLDLDRSAIEQAMAKSGGIVKDFARSKQYENTSMLTMEFPLSPKDKESMARQSVGAARAGYYQGLKKSLEAQGIECGPMLNTNFGPLPGGYCVSTIQASGTTIAGLNVVGIASDKFLSVTMYCPEPPEQVTPEMKAFTDYFSRLNISDVNLLAERSTAYEMGYKFGRYAAFLIVPILGVVLFLFYSVRKSRG